MKKKFFLTLIAVSLFTIGVKAQETNQNKNVIWGIKGNLNAEIPTKWRANGESFKMYNSGFGLFAGGLVNIYLGKNFYFEPELGLFYEGYSYDKIITVAPNSPSVNAGPNIYKIGLRVPIIFGYSLDISEKWGLNFFTGPQLSYAFAGKVTTKVEEFKDDENLMTLFGKEYGQRRFDLGWKIGIGFPVDHFMISLEADLGITDILKKVYTCRENRLGLGITYYF